MRRREVLLGGSAAAVLLSGQRALAQNQVRRIGFFGTATEAGYSSLLESFRKGLREFGWEEGRNVEIEYRWANGRYDQLPSLAQDLVRSNPDVLLTHGTPGTSILQKATRDIPIVIAVSGEAVATGLIKSFAHPGGNTTGQSFLAAEMSEKRLELLKETIPALSRLATVFNPGNPFAKLDLAALGEMGKSIGVVLQPFPVRGPDDFKAAFSSLSAAGFQAVSIIHDSILTAAVKPLADLALQYRLPSIGEGSYVEAGGLIGYGPDFHEMWRTAASYVDKLLRGARAADLPVQLPTKFEFLLNLKTARILGLEISPDLLVRADAVIGEA